MFRNPFIIGDRLTTSSKAVKDAAEQGDLEALASIARRQLAAGADALDIAACSSGMREQEHLGALIGGIARIDQPVVCSIDTYDPEVISDARRLLNAPPILNCYSGLLDSLPEMQAAIRSAFPITAVIAVCLDFVGADVRSTRRLDIAERMESELIDTGVRRDQIIFDPVTLPLCYSAEPDAEQITLETMGLLRQAFPHAGVLCAVSNYSYGMARRREAERGYLQRAKSHGASVFLLNALNTELCRIAREPL